MLENFKNQSIVTKVLYLLAILLFILWVIPSMVSYYSDIEHYKGSKQEISKLSSKYGVDSQTQLFSKELFQKNTEKIFEKVIVQNLDEKRYSIEIEMKREDLKNFHNFIDTLSLRYYVQIEGELKFKAKDDTVHASFIISKL